MFRLAIAVVAVAVSGCVRLEQEVIMRKDGSGTVSYHYSVAADTQELLVSGQRVIQAWQGMSVTASPSSLNWFFNESRVRKYFDGAHMALEQYRRYTRQGRRHVEFSVAVRDVAPALGTGRFGAFALSRTAAGNVLFRAALAGQGDTAPVLKPEQFERLRPLCADLWLRLRVVVPNAIIESSAPAAGRRRATWTFDPATDASFLLRTPEIKLVFEGAGLDWPKAE